jgi:CRISPR-associated protein Cmr2
MTYTAIAFAPVQSFIRSSRKLRDLYGSSLLLSHLARALYVDASEQLGDDAVISPAGVSISRGVPNTLIIVGHYSASRARGALLAAWKQVLTACRDWLEQNVDPRSFPAPPDGWTGDWEAGWGASWKAAERHSWEVFQGQGPTIAAARQALAIAKQQRDWSIPNWTGESSSLSSAEAIVRPTMATVVKPWTVDATAAQQEARSFLAQLCKPDLLGEAFAEVNEEISLLELVKRLITYDQILKEAFVLGNAKPDAEVLLKGFAGLSTRQNLQGNQRPESIIWFMADGDRISKHLQKLATEKRGQGEKGDELAHREFSSSMRQWATGLYTDVPACMTTPSTATAKPKATLVYAGGDDVLGALHESTPGARDLHVEDLWHWVMQFPVLWAKNNQPTLSISMGLVWAEANVPQREALQHARDAEASAKARGRDRFALRLLYPSGNHLQWTCPWPWIQPILQHYRDREGRQSRSGTWRHLADDLVWLQERQSIGYRIHSPTDKQKDQKRLANKDEHANATALALWKAYFPGLHEMPSANAAPTAEPDSFSPSLLQPEADRPFHRWLVDLGLVMAGLEKRRDRLGQNQTRALQTATVAR